MVDGIRRDAYAFCVGMLRDCGFRERKDMQGAHGDGKRTWDCPRHERQLHLVNGLAQTCKKNLNVRLVDAESPQLLRPQRG